MSVTLALLLAVPLVGSTRLPAPTFQDMLDSAQLVVIAKVDSMWEQWDTLILDSTKSLWPRTYVSAELLTVYVKDTTLIPRSNSICLAYIGGCGYMVVRPSFSFKEGELFLASVEKDKPYLIPPDEKIYRVPISHWKYTIANDTLVNQYTPPIPLGDALQWLSSHFLVIGAEK